MQQGKPKGRHFFRTEIGLKALKATRYYSTHLVDSPPLVPMPGNAKPRMSQTISGPEFRRTQDKKTTLQFQGELRRPDQEEQD